MGRLIKNLLIGARQALVLRPPIDYIKPSRSDFRKDYRALKGDMQRFAADLRRVTDRYGEQIHYR